MTSRASHPLNAAAVRAANAQLYRQHPELVVNGRERRLDPNSKSDAKFRAEWMALYSTNGGRVTPTNTQNALDLRQKIIAQFGTKRPTYPATTCRLTGGKAITKPTASVPRKLPAQSLHARPCELLSVSMICSHGRMAGPQQVVMVVPGAHAVSDSVSVSLSMKGGCGRHPYWSYGSTPSDSGSSTKFKIDARQDVYGPTLRWWLVSPKKCHVTTSACAGLSPSWTIEVYPGEKSSLAIDFKQFNEALENAKSFIKGTLVDDSSAFEFKALVGKFAGESQWSEDPGTWTAHCASTVKLGLSPLLSVNCELPIASIIPPKMERWVKAGVYVDIGGSLECFLQATWKDWPHNGTVKITEYGVDGTGNIAVALAGKVKLFAKTFLSGSVSGTTGADFDLDRRKDGAIGFEISWKWSGLKAKLSGSLLWGVMETEREFTLLAPSESRKLYDWKL